MWGCECLTTFLQTQIHSDLHPGEIGDIIFCCRQVKLTFINMLISFLGFNGVDERFHESHVPEKSASKYFSEFLIAHFKALLDQIKDRCHGWVEYPNLCSAQFSQQVCFYLCKRKTIWTVGDGATPADKHCPGYLKSTHQRTFLLFLHSLVLWFICSSVSHLLCASYAAACCLPLVSSSVILHCEQQCA